MVRNEQLSSNPYSLSKNISDLEFLGLIKCVTLFEKTNSNKIYYDSTQSEHCLTQFFPYKYYFVEFKAISGSTYVLSYSPPLILAKLFLEAICYLLSILFSFLYFKSLRADEILTEIQIKNSFETSQAVDQLAKQLAHDIRSPLSAINMVAGTLKNTSEEQISIISNAAKRINQIANDLLSKEQKNKFVLSLKQQGSEKAPSNESTTVYESLSLLFDEKTAQYSNLPNLDFHLDLEIEESVCISISSAIFDRIISNLVNNAVEALPERSGNVTISARKNGSYITVVISDDGVGIPSDILSKIGERGFSFGKSETESGSGLGIWYSKKSVEEVGGKFSILSKSNIGTQIIMSFAEKIIGP